MKMNGAELQRRARILAVTTGCACVLALAAGRAWAQADEASGARSEAPNIPPVTLEDREAAFPDLGDADARNMMIERPLNYLVKFDHLERHDTEPDETSVWGLDSWVGTSLNRLLVRSEGERSGGTTEHADLELLYGRAVTKWFSVTAGARRDFGEGPERNWAAFGLEGLAPYWFELEATGYVGEGGRTAARLEAEYELLLTQRLVLQPKLEADWYGEADRARGIGSGLSSTEVGLRLRYEIRREVAPYIGYVWERKHGATAEFARAAGHEARDHRLVAGIRLWF